MHTTHKNIIANYAGKLWGFISVYLFIPIYVKILGVETYGVIGFYTVLLSIMLIADAGLSATFNREAARTDDKLYLSNLLRTFEYLYLGICLCITLLVIGGSSIIAANWLHSDSIPKEQLPHYVSLMGICVALQLFITLYNGGLNGLQKQVLLNKIQIGYSLFRSGLVIIPVFFIPNLYVYFIWQIIINLLALFFTRYQVWRFIKTEEKPVFSFILLRGVWKFAMGMLVMALLSSLNTQLDKLLTGKFLSLKDFSLYSLAGILANIPVTLILPIAIAVLPQLTRLSEEKRTEELKEVYCIYSSIIAIISVIVTSILFVFTKEFAHIWLHDSEIVAGIDIITKILIVGGMFLSLQFMPFYLAIANGHNITNIKVSLIGLLVIIPALILLIPRYGLVGASIPWLCLNFLAFCILGYVLTNRFLPGTFTKWITKDILLPLFLCFAAAGIVYIVTLYFPKGYFVLLYGCVIAGLSVLFNYFAMQKMHPEIGIKDYIYSIIKRK
jgi:O-antigen/teichoic acid export membrane protein